MQADLMLAEQDHEDVFALNVNEQHTLTQTHQATWEVLNTSNGEGGCRQRDDWRSSRNGLKPYSEYYTSVGAWSPAESPTDSVLSK